VDGDVEDDERTFLERVVRIMVLICRQPVKPGGGFLMNCGIVPGKNNRGTIRAREGGPGGGGITRTIVLVYGRLVKPDSGFLMEG